MGDDILVCSVGRGGEEFKFCKQILFEILDVKQFHIFNVT
jgi:hypothetical protein